MTNEEAIEILEEVKILDDSMYQYNPIYLEALDMAISALEDKGYEQGYNDGYTDAMRDVAGEVK